MIYCFFLIQEHTDPVKNALSAVDRYEVKKTNVVKFAESARSNFDASKSASAIGHDRPGANNAAIGLDEPGKGSKNT
jgi:hypothetical protein